uniref:Structure-specific endonuclease subunit SLX4 n=1 Tax=Heliothis virescens TaxID=7102 RepID=A0A2A4J541_HELVI
MSIDSNSEVKSKYFTGQTDMDESLSDFQEAKKSCKGPKPAQKVTKPKTRKATKRIKGQKDIRTALKGKKNEIVSYTKEFDTVCKKSGLDVDPEQLQLAIALSKSLHTETESPETSQALTSQQRVAKIRKTLQEYGFKVPEAKITATRKTKKFRKNYKLLTATEEQKKELVTGKYAQILFQNIHPLEHNSPNNFDSEARVFYIGSSIPYECMKDNDIFYVDNLVERSVTNGSLLRDWSEIPGRPVSPQLFDSFKMSFKEMQCSQDELDVILSGSLKNVKNIFASKQIEFENECENKYVQKVIIDDDKENVSSDNNRTLIKDGIINIDDNDHECETENKPLSQNLFNIESPVKNIINSLDRPIIEVKLPDDDVIEITSPVKLTTDPNKVIDIENTNKLTVSQQYRSCSPDIFDDELSSIMETTKPVNILSQEHKTKVFSQDNVMDLTECVNIPSQGLEKTLLSQNVTKRRSNDLMEITECVVGSSQPIREDLKEIDLTQSPEANDVIIKEGNQSINIENNIDDISIILSTKSQSNSVNQNVTDEHNITVLMKQPNTDSTQREIQIAKDIDLTQSSNEEDKDMSIVNLSNGTPDKKDVESMDLTQSSNSNDVDGLPLVNIGTQRENSLDETIIVDKDEYIANGKVKKSIIFERETQHDRVHVVCDLTQAHDDSIDKPVINENNVSQSYSFYDDFVHDHSENTETSKEVEQDRDKTKDDNTSHNESKESDDIDLTQGSDTSEEMLVSQSLALHNVPNNSSLGKKDDVSIDYDEIILDDNIDNDKSLNLKYESFKSEVGDDIEIVDANNDIEMSSSQHSEVFQISDRELDYSLHKSKHDFLRDNFDIGGISVLDNATKLSSFKKSLSEGCLSIIGPIKNDTLGDSFLPDIFTKKTEEKTSTYIHKPGETSPIKVQDVTRNDNGVIHIKTPKNTEYVIKTDNVTPIADYASMSTPQRNRELDKYGLKPFKRKRAIQILTHLYNQTHPTIQELLNEDQPSPSKKQRLNYDIEQTSPQNLMTSPAKSNQNSNTQRTPVKSRMSERDRDILSAPSPSEGELKEVVDVCVYEVTSEAANLKSVDCDPDDWVFQKREKAKVHSCRVPLHIAFHNYVLSRRSLREAILKYEPVNIDIIHKDLVGYGHRYDPKDLLKFLDKKCITVKTTDNNSRNNKR